MPASEKKPRKKPERKPPRFTCHTEIPSGTCVFTETVLQIRPGSRVSLWRDIRRGRYPKPSGYTGNRPYWIIDIVRAVANGQWKGDAA